MIFSYSFLDQFYNVCPESARQQFVTRRFKKTFEVKDGIDIHREIEARVKQSVPLPSHSANVEPYIKSFEKQGELNVEVPLAVDRMMRPVAFWSKLIEPYLRGKFDVFVRRGSRAVLADWKSGKKREKPDQLEIGALLLFENEPEIETVTGVNVWLKTQELGQPYVFHRRDKGMAWARWIAKMKGIEALEPNKEWPKRQGPLCNWCPVTECEHNGSYTRN